MVLAASAVVEAVRNAALSVAAPFNACFASVIALSAASTSA